MSAFVTSIAGPLPHLARHEQCEKSRTGDILPEDSLEGPACHSRHIGSAFVLHDGEEGAVIL